MSLDKHKLRKSEKDLDKVLAEYETNSSGKILDEVMKPVKKAFSKEYAPKISEYGGMLSVGIATVDDHYTLAARVILPKDQDLAAKLQEENLLPSKYKHKGHEWEVSIGYLSRPQAR